MKAFILAAGLGTRLRPLTDSQPKVMLEVGGKKILERTLEQLKVAGISDVVVNTHYQPKIVTDYFGDGSGRGMRINYSHEPAILGTAGGLKNARQHFSGEQEFVVVYGDNVFDVDFSQFIAEPLQQNLGLIMLFNRKKNRHSGVAGGVVEIDEARLVKSFKEGSADRKTDFVNGGVYKFTQEIFEHIPEKSFSDFGKEIFPAILQKNISLKAYVLPAHEAIFGIDLPESLENTHRYFFKKL